MLSKWRLIFECILQMHENEDGQIKGFFPCAETVIYTFNINYSKEMNDLIWNCNKDSFLEVISLAFSKSTILLQLQLCREVNLHKTSLELFYKKDLDFENWESSWKYLNTDAIWFKLKADKSVENQMLEHLSVTHTMQLICFTRIKSDSS